MFHLFNHNSQQSDAQSDNAGERIQRALRAVRTHLGLQIAYVSRLDGHESVFRAVDAPGFEAKIKPGDRRRLSDIYCKHILDGRLPELIPDTSAEPVATALPITKQESIGCHLSVPIRLSDGRVYGMFCCVGFSPDPSLNMRDLATLKAFSEIVAFEINSELVAAEAMAEKRERIELALADGNLSVALQPIWKIGGNGPCRVVGFEALARFGIAPHRSPDQWFAEAEAVGMGVRLEHLAVRRAFETLPLLPPSMDLCVNVSAPAILDGGFAKLFETVDPRRIVLEFTEHSMVENYDTLLEALRPWRERGVRLAVDDAGAGYASLRHVLNMRPDLVKLDMGLTRDIDRDAARRALARALVTFSYETGCRIVAEGVETTSELETLRAIGIGKAQGYLLGKPLAVADAVRLATGAQTGPAAAA